VTAKKQCAGCERSFEARGNRAKWCPSCKSDRTREADDRYNAKRDGRAHGDGWSLTIVESHEDFGEMRVRLSVEMTAQELASMYALHRWLIGTKAGQAAMERHGMPLPVLGVCDTTGTPTVGVPALMFAVEHALALGVADYRNRG
jgi:hypothetical protein